MNIKAFKLTSGEEIIAELISETETEYTINNPVGLADKGNGQIGFIPFFVLSQEREMIISKDQVMIPAADVLDEPRQNYEGLFSAIITPPSEILHG